MENLLKRNDSDKKFQNHHLSCLLRMFHVLVYHQKSNLKRLRKNNPLCCQAPKTISLERENPVQKPQSDAVLTTDVNGNSKASEVPSVTYISSPTPIIILKDDGESKRRCEKSDSAKDKVEVFQVNKKLVVDLFSEPKNSTPKRKIVRSGSFPVEKPSTLESKMRETFPHIKTSSESKTNPRTSSASRTTRSRKTFVVSYVINLKNKIKRALKYGDSIVESETSMIRATSHKEFLENCNQLLTRTENYSRISNGDGTGREIVRSSSLKTFRRKSDLDYFVHYDISESQAPRETHPTKLDTEAESQNEERSPISVLETRFPEESITQDCKNEDKMKSEVSTMSELSASSDPEEKYIGEVLYASGFVEAENATKWNTMGEPMDPRLYNVVEEVMYGEERGERKEVFDAVNEALVEIFGGALRYFPAEMSAPAGVRLVREVRKRVGKMRECGERESAHGSEWMNLIYDVEDVALDVEDVIFDELLHETVMSFFMSPS